MTTNPQTDARAADLLVADARRAVHESLIVFAAPEADRVRALIADLETAVEGRTAIHLAAVSVPASAPTDRATEVEERTARYLFDQDWTRTLDVDAARKLLAAVLPARDDQAADWGALVRETGRLRLEAIELHDQATELDARVAEFELRGTAEIYASVAELVRAMADEHPSNAAWVQDCQHIADRIAAAASGSGRVADETQAEAEGLRCVCGDPVQLMDGSDPTSWIHSPGSDTRCLDARPRCPECQIPHDLTPSMKLKCASIRAGIADQEAQQPDDEALRAKVDEATTTLRRIRSKLRELKDQGATGWTYHQVITEALAGPRPDSEPDPETEEEIVREHVTTVHLIGEQLADVESWLWKRLAEVRAEQPAVVSQPDGEA